MSQTKRSPASAGKAKVASPEPQVPQAPAEPTLIDKLAAEDAKMLEHQTNVGSCRVCYEGDGKKG
jgi:hypothetical protein